MAYPTLLDLLFLEKATVTIDAMGGHKAIVKKKWTTKPIILLPYKTIKRTFMKKQGTFSR